MVRAAQLDNKKSGSAAHTGSGAVMCPDSFVDSFVHLLIKALYKLFVCLFTNFLSYFLPSLYFLHYLFTS